MKEPLNYTKDEMLTAIYNPKMDLSHSNLFTYPMNFGDFLSSISNESLEFFFMLGDEDDRYEIMDWIYSTAVSLYSSEMDMSPYDLLDDTLKLKLIDAMCTGLILEKTKRDKGVLELSPEHLKIRYLIKDGEEEEAM